jgi:DNA invertase Pin-like site-specific DNA recombinase
MAAGRKALRAAPYERVSTLAGGSKARSIDEQNEANAKAIAEHGWIAAGRYQDPGRSASRFARRDREEYDRLTADLGRGAFDVLVLWEPSRGGRNLTIWSGLLDKCRERGVKVYVTSHDHLYDLSVGRDWHQLAGEGVSSAWETEQTSERVRRALDSNAREGRPHGRCPFGYERAYDPQTRELIEQRPCPPAAGIVREIIRRVAGAEPSSRIADDLAARGAISPAGGRWNAAAVRRIAASPVYIGKRRSAALGDTDAIWPPIADEMTWHAARRVLDAGRRARRKPGLYRWMLSYLATCARCGGFLSVALAAEGGGTRHGSPLYCCVNGCVSIRQDWLDDFITGIVASEMADPERYRMMAGTGDAAILAARGEADALQRQLDGHALAAARREISGRALSIIEAELAPAIADAEKRARKAAMPALMRNLDPEADMREQFAHAHVAAQKDMVRMMFAKIEVGPSLARGRQKAFDPRRVTFEWRKPG